MRRSHSRSSQSTLKENGGTPPALTDATEFPTLGARNVVCRPSFKWIQFSTIHRVESEEHDFSAKQAEKKHDVSIERVALEIDVPAKQAEYESAKTSTEVVHKDSAPIEEVAHTDECHAVTEISQDGRVANDEVSNEDDASAARFAKQKRCKRAKKVMKEDDCTTVKRMEYDGHGPIEQVVKNGDALASTCVKLIRNATMKKLVKENDRHPAQNMKQHGCSPIEEASKVEDTPVAQFVAQKDSAAFEKLVKNNEFHTIQNVKRDGYECAPIEQVVKDGDALVSKCVKLDSIASIEKLVKENDCHAARNMKQHEGFPINDVSKVSDPLVPQLVKQEDIAPLNKQFKEDYCHAVQNMKHYGGASLKQVLKAENTPTSKCVKSDDRIPIEELIKENDCHSVQSMKQDEGSPIEEASKVQSTLATQFLEQDHRLPFEQVLKVENPPASKCVKSDDSAPIEEPVKGNDCHAVQTTQQHRGLPIDEASKEEDLSASKCVISDHSAPIEELIKEDDCYVVPSMKQHGGSPTKEASKMKDSSLSNCVTSDHSAHTKELANEDVQNKKQSGGSTIEESANVALFVEHERHAFGGKVLKKDDVPVANCFEQECDALTEKVVKEGELSMTYVKCTDSVFFKHNKHEANPHEAICLPLQKVVQKDDFPKAKNAQQNGNASSRFDLTSFDEFPSISSMSPKERKPSYKAYMRPTVEQHEPVSVMELTTSPSCSDLSYEESPASVAEDRLSPEQEESETSSMFAVNLAYGEKKSKPLVEVAKADGQSSLGAVYSASEFIAYRNSIQDSDAMIRWTTAERRHTARSPKRCRSDANVSPDSKKHSDNWHRHSRIPISVDELPRLARSNSAWSCCRKSLQPHGATDEAEAKKVKKIKGILNKLSDGNFKVLVAQLMDIGLTTRFRVDVLCSEIFEKAITQHGFIDLYTRLCIYLDKEKVCATERSTFRSVLLATCQAHFEKCLLPPEGMLDNKVEDIDAFEREIKYKNAMLGNIKFVGALLCERLVASKVLLGMANELLETGTAVSLESLCVLLTRCGATFDRVEWPHYVNFDMLFASLQVVARTNRIIGNRVKFLIADVLDLRQRKWATKTSGD